MPKYSQIHQDTFLTNLSIAFQAIEGISSRIPAIPVTKDSNKINIIDPGDMARTGRADFRSPGTAGMGGDHELTTKSFLLKEVSWFEKINEEDEANADEPIDLYADAQMVCDEAIMRRWEEYFESKVWGTGKWAVDYTPSTLWSAGGTPLKDVGVQAAVIRKKRQIRQSDLTFIVGEDVHAQLQEHSTMRDISNPTSQKPPDEEFLRNQFRLKNYWVASTNTNTAAKGAADSFDWLLSPKDALLVHIVDAPSKRRPGALCRLARKMTAESRTGSFRIPIPWEFHTRVYSRRKEDIVIIDASGGVYFSGAVA